MSDRPMTADASAFIDAAIDAFLADGEDHTVKQLAERLGWTERRVRKAIDDECGGPRGLTWHQIAIPTYSRDYPTMATGRCVKAWAYGPHREQLRQMLLESRKAPST